MENGKVSDATRIERVLPTIREIADKGGKVILLAHFGRPKGGPDEANSLRPVAAAVADLYGKPVGFAADCIGPVAEAAVASLKDGDVLLLENTRFHKQEEKNDPAFVEALAKLGDLYVNDAFSAAHRAHASTEGVAHKLPACAGRAMQAELDALTLALGSPSRPVAAIVGGAKVSTKLDLLGNLVKKVDTLIIGGGMANTFLFALGKPIGKSLGREGPRRHRARDPEGGGGGELPHSAAGRRQRRQGVQGPRAGALRRRRPCRRRRDDPRHRAEVDPRGRGGAERLRSTLVWNGPFGAFELHPFDAGTSQVAKTAAALTEAKKLKSVAGGGDTVSALNAAGVADKFTYVSTAGGAFLEWMEGKALPGVEALRTQ